MPEHPVEIIAHDSRFRRHRTHLLKLFQLSIGLLTRFLRQFGLCNPIFQLGHFVAAILAVAEFLLDRLHLLIQIVLALRLLHLPLYARTDTLFHLKNGNLALHQPENPFQPAGHGYDAEDFLLFRNFDRQMRRDRIGQLRIIVDLANGAQNFWRNFLVELHVVFEFRNDGTRKSLDLDRIAFLFRQNAGVSLKQILAIGIVADFGASSAFHQHLDGVVRQFQKLENRRQRADFVNILWRRIVIGGVYLRGKQDLLVRIHDLFKRPDRLFSPDEQRHDHVREHNNVA